MEKVLLGQKVLHLEEMTKLYKEQVDGLTEEMNKVWTKINLMANWISNRFGVELSDQNELGAVNMMSLQLTSQPTNQKLRKPERLPKLKYNNSSFQQKSLKSSFRPKVGFFKSGKRKENLPNTKNNISQKNDNSKIVELSENKILEFKANSSKVTLSKAQPNNSCSLPHDSIESIIVSRMQIEASLKNESPDQKSVNSHIKTSISNEEIMRLKTHSKNPSEFSKENNIGDNALPDKNCRDPSKVNSNNGHNPLNTEFSQGPALIEGPIDSKSASELLRQEQRRGRPKKRPEEKVENWKKRTPMVCDECGKVLKGAGSLRSHKQTHSNERPHKCLLCSKAFRMKHHLDFHLLTHEGDKKWTCRFCNKGFIAQRDVLRHERTHTGERPYSCNFPNCPKSFNVKQHLTLHIRTHTGEKPYQCNVCKKNFSQANSLRIHKKIHTKGEGNNNQEPKINTTVSEK